MEKILIVEDDRKIREELCSALEKKGYACILLEQFEDVAGQILREAPDLVLLDLNLPVQDGFYICQEVRKQTDVPVIVVTSSDSDMDELMSLHAGADDFVTKPYNMHVLLAHIATVLHRAYGRKPSMVLTHNGLSLDLMKSRISFQEHAGSIISRTDLICSLWAMEEFVEDSTLNVNINRLRKKLADLGLDHYLVTKRGQGYMV